MRCKYIYDLSVVGCKGISEYDVGYFYAPYAPVLIPMIRRVLPSLIAHDILGVQPMTEPTGLIFNMRNNMSITANSQQMNFKTKDLVARLESNKEKHIAEFNDAMVGYREIIGKLLKEASKKFKSGKDTYTQGFSLQAQAPRSYEKEYATIIEMLKMCTDEEINLDRSSFQNYVMDEWNWTSQFKASTALYASASLGK